MALQIASQQTPSNENYVNYFNGEGEIGHPSLITQTTKRSRDPPTIDHQTLIYPKIWDSRVLALDLWDAEVLAVQKKKAIF